MRAHVFGALLVGYTAAQCSGSPSVLTGSAGSVVAPPEFHSADCQWIIQTNLSYFIEINFTDFFIDTRPPFCQDTPGFPLRDVRTNDVFACDQLGSVCDVDVVLEVCPASCYLCDSCSYNYVEVTGTDAVQYFHDCQSISTPLIVDALNSNVFVTTTRSYFSDPDPTPVPSADRLAFTWRALPLANHTHSNYLCKGTVFLTEDNGTFTDGSAPSASYQPNANCIWIITAPDDMYVELTFDLFELQRATVYDQYTTFQTCSSDKVSIIDGSEDSDSASLIGEYCGTNMPPVVLSSSQNLTIVFKSDLSIERTGFSAHYRFVNNGSIPPEHCTGNATYDQVEGEANVVSGLLEQECAWHIIPPPNKYVQITFLTHSLTPHQPSCTDDVIYIMQGTKFLQKSCDQYLPPSVTGTASGAAGALNVSFNAQIQTLEYFHFVWTFVDTPGIEPMTCNSTTTILAQINDTGYINDGTRYGIATYPNQNCSWTIVAPSGYLVHFDYIYFSIESYILCGYDYVSVSSGVNGATLLQKACGLNLPNHVQSTTNTLVVRMFTDNEVNYDGFGAIWSVVPASAFVAPCNGLQPIDATVQITGNITDNSGGYASQKNCSWLITAPPNKFISIEIIMINMFPKEDGYDVCVGETLSAWDGSSPSSSNYLFFQTCGTDNPGIQITTNNTVFLQYQSAEQIRNGGFLVRWSVVSTPGNTTGRSCFGQVSLPVNSNDQSGTISTYTPGVTYRPNSNCSYLITVPNNKYVRITWNYFELQYKDYMAKCYDYVSVLNGNSSNSYELQRSCGSGPPLPVTTTVNQALVQFVSDAAIQAYGFVATWTISDTPGGLTCSGVKNIYQSPLSGFITDGAIAGLGYVNNARCTWKLTAPAGLVVAIKFIEVSIEPPSGSVCQDYLEFIDNAVPRARICGVMGPNLLAYEAFTSQTSNLDINFYSDNANAGAGFNISYAFVAPPPKGADNSSKVDVIVAAVLITFFAIVILCCLFVYCKKRQAANAIAHIDLARGQDLNRKRTMSGGTDTAVPVITDDIESTGPTPI